MEVPELKEIVEENWDNEDVLKEILNVLRIQKKSRSKRLKEKLTARLPELKGTHYTKNQVDLRGTHHTKKQVDSIKFNGKKDNNFNGFKKIGNATQKAVDIINTELKKHYLNDKDSYLTKRCLENGEWPPSTGICNIIRAFIEFGNENEIKDLSRADSNAIIDFINPMSDKQVRAYCFLEKNKAKTRTPQAATTSVGTRPPITTTESDIIHVDTASTISKLANGKVPPAKNKNSRRSKGNHVYGMKQRKYELEVKSSKKKGLNFIGFLEMGEASTKAVEIVNAELEKHYDDWDNSYLKKRCDEFYGFTAIRFAIQNFIFIGNEKFIQLLSNEDSRAIDEFINGKESTKPKTDVELRDLCFKLNTNNLKLDRTVPQEIEIAQIKDLAQEIKPLTPVLKKQKEKLTPEHKNLEEEETHYEYRVEKNQQGYSYEVLFDDRLVGTKKLNIDETYLHYEQQFHNLLEFLLFYQNMIPKNDSATINLNTKEAHRKSEKETQAYYLEEIKTFLKKNGIPIELRITIKSKSSQIHDRRIVADNGWRFIWGRGMDIFQKEEFVKNKGYTNKNQKERNCKPFFFTAFKN